MSDHPWLVQLITVLVPIVIIAVGLLARFQYRTKIQNLFYRLDALGENIKDRKDAWLDRWVDKIRIPADWLTLLRLPLVLGSLWLYQSNHNGLAIFCFFIGWLTDMFDGLKSRAEARTRGRVTRHGKYLDVSIDLACFIAMIVILHHAFPTVGVWILSAAVTFRSLYGVILLIFAGMKRTSRPLRFLPDSIAGKYKTVFLALAFGSAIGWPDSGQVKWWSVATFTIAVILEVISLAQQFGRCLCRKVTTP